MQAPLHACMAMRMLAHVYKEASTLLHCHIYQNNEQVKIGRKPNRFTVPCLWPAAAHTEAPKMFLGMFC